MSVQVINGKFPHIKWIDLKGDGTVVECAVLKTDRNNNIYYIQIDKLDAIDRGRIIKILKTRNIENMELWDAMSTVTLGNGVNALKYFHQLVKVITDAGVIMTPQLGKQGVVLINDEQKRAPTPDMMADAAEMIKAGEDAGVKPTAKRLGRPKKSAA